MAFKGNLRDFSIPQIFNLINLAQKTGTLIVEGSGEKVWVSFRAGKLAYAQRGSQDTNLLGVLHQAGKLSAAQYRRMNQRAGKLNDKELGLMLMQLNYLNQQVILQVLEAHYTAAVSHLLRWDEGHYHFDNHLLPPAGKITLRIPLEKIITESSQRILEWEQLQVEVPNLEAALRFTDHPEASLREANLSVEEWRVASSINPKNSIRQIAHASQLDDLEVRRIVHKLLKAGFVEIVPGQDITGETGAPPVQPKNGEQRSLLNRLFQRFRNS